VQLDILVENSGRISYPAVAMRGDRKGITNAVTLAGAPVVGWDVYPLPMLQPSELPFSHAACEGPCFYRATFNVDAPADTFFDTRAFSKGEVWLNGRALGRVWKIGPQKTLYVPGPWLRKGENSVVVFDLNGEPGRSLAGTEKPILGSTAQWLYSRLLFHRRLSMLSAGVLTLFAVLLVGWRVFERRAIMASQQG
jgi:beta-galactosidase